MALLLVEEKLRQTILRSTAVSYGLTFVIGLPFPSEIGSQLQQIQARLEAWLPNRFTWYGLDHLHATVVAPLRGRYRAQPPLQREELPANFDAFTHDLDNLFSQLAPFPLILDGVHLTEDGLVMVSCNKGSHLRQAMTACLQKYPAFEPPKHSGLLHISIGYINTGWPFTSAQERAYFNERIAQFTNIASHPMLVDQVWLVHYANRTLKHIVGKVSFQFGVTNPLPPTLLWEDLGIKGDISV